MVVDAKMCFWVDKRSGYMELCPAVGIDRAIVTQLGLLIHRNKAFCSLLCSEQGPEAQALSR